MALLLAVASAVQADPKQALQTKGLELKGKYFVVKEENDLNKEIFELRKRKGALDKVIREQRSTERKISQAKAIIAQKEYELRKLQADVAKAATAVQQNRLIAEMNQARELIEKAVEFKRENEEKIQAARAEARQNYVEFVLQLGIRFDEVDKKYAGLTEDAEVKAAIDELNAEIKKYELGPSSAYQSYKNLLDKDRGEILSADIEMRPEGNVNWVEVMINGKYTREMVLDSGAGLLSIPHDMAKELGLEPTDQHPTIRLRLADGKIVDGKLMVLDSVQVGQFKVKEVECAVLPESLIAAEPLLGGSYLKHFTYRIDSAKNKLRMVKIKGDEDEEEEEAAK